ncbi:hypothetical protein TELCIR_02072 [Teladorsagia circumcincta]|uniref:Uncharacterized protein n=1 Tax=Teladorsagia circumcincta TaxID=45464 RepID=A0A2G9V066_TELCI|nr:hypothetical protein TELCIR_02072 [Teladorsagia circumcincta]
MVVECYGGTVDIIANIVTHDHLEEGVDVIVRRTRSGEKWTILVYASSTCPEMTRIGVTTDEKTVEKLRMIFAAHELLGQIVPDNGPPVLSTNYIFYESLENPKIFGSKYDQCRFAASMTSELSSYDSVALLAKYEFKSLEETRMRNFIQTIRSITSQNSTYTFPTPCTEC